MNNKKIKVLMIEDSIDDATLIKRRLENSTKSHFSVADVRTLDEGLQYLSHHVPDIIISDLGLPDSHGLDTVNRIVKKAPDIPLVVLSGFDDESLAIKAVQAGAQDYLIKGQAENPQLERSLFYSIERARLQGQVEKHSREITGFQKNMHQILEKNTDALLVIDNKNRILYANPAVQSLFGRAREELINEELTLPLASGKTVEIEIERPDQEKKTAEMSVVNIDWESQPAILVSMHDITRHKKMEKDLKESEERFSKVFQHSPEVILITDLTDGTILEANDSFFRLTGYSRHEVIGRRFSDLGMWVDLQDMENLNRAIKENRIISNLEYKFRMKSGEIRTWLFSGEIINIGGELRVLSVNIDITERKKMEDRFRFSDVALKSIHEGIIAMDNDFKITYWNEMCEQMLGIKAADAMGKEISDIVTIVESYEGQNRKHLELLLEKGFCREEQLYRTSRGDIWMDAQCQTIEYSGKRYGWLTLLSDISARKQAEEALKQSEERYRELINTSPDAIISVDSEMKIIIWNSGAEKIFGYTEKEALGQPFLMIIPEESRVKAVDLFNGLSKSVVRVGADQITYLMCVRKNGSRVPIELSIFTRKAGNAIITTGILRDITLRKESEEALKRSEEKYRELINTSNDTIISLDPQMRFIVWNYGAEKLLGYNEEEILGKSIMTIFPPEVQKDMAKELIRLKQPAAGSTVNNVFETTVIKKDGSAVPVDVSASARKTGEGSIITAIIRDITLRKEAEAKLRQIDQMKSEFLSNVSHELRTPLQSICGFTRLILSGEVPDTTTQQEFLEIIDQEALHLGHLINSLLDMTRLESGHFQIYRQPAAIRNTINDSLKMFQSLARQKNIEFHEEISPELPVMHVDVERMRQVIINLVGNAIKYSEPGGSINITANTIDNELVFSVTDHGAGIREENIKHLFERFYRAEGDTARGGTGLGLFISRQIIEAHGGRIWVESKIGKGSTFSFALPLNG